jgi:hypothetical protein
MRDFRPDLRRLLVESSDRIAHCPGHEMIVVIEEGGCEIRVCEKCALVKIFVRAALFSRIPPPYQHSDLDRYLEARRAFDFSPLMVRTTEEWGAGHTHRRRRKSSAT